MKRRNIFLTLLVLTGLTVGALTAAQTVHAQGPDNTGTADEASFALELGELDGPVAQLGMVGPGMGLVCSTTDYTDVAAKALGMTAAELRVALVSGKTINDLATSKNITLQTVQDALTKARQADIDQAVKDGLIPQQMADIMNGRSQNQNNNQGGIRRGIGGMLMNLFGNRMGFGISTRNVARPYVAAAQSVGVSCPDLIKALQQGDSIVNVATKKNVQAQTVIDAVVKAYKDALAQDVKEGLITQAQADGQSVRLVERVTAFISRSGRMTMRMMPRMPGQGQQGQGQNQPGGRDGRNGNPGGRNPGNQPTAPNAPATPQATPAR
ncbi:MAG: hypothetical protein IT324_07545 [Anaerolineae bacterium]|nr:hypothetical protein [Anaerolineae bacterium]